MTEPEPELTRRDEAVIRAELAQVDAAMIEAQHTYRVLALRRLQLVGELIAPAMEEHLADQRAADRVAEGSERGDTAAPGTDTPGG